MYELFIYRHIHFITYLFSLKCVRLRRHSLGFELNSLSVSLLLNCIYCMYCVEETEIKL